MASVGRCYQLTTCMYMYIHHHNMRTPMHAHMHMYVCTHTHIHTCVCAHTHTHTHTLTGLGPRHYTVHLRAVLLLQFMEHLDKLMYNAYEGSCVTLPPVPKVSQEALPLVMNLLLSTLASLPPYHTNLPLPPYSSSLSHKPPSPPLPILILLITQTSPPLPHTHPAYIRYLYHLLTLCEGNVQQFVVCVW